jgi:hypothetical protein
MEESLRPPLRRADLGSPAERKMRLDANQEENARLYEAYLKTKQPSAPNALERVINEIDSAPFV